MSTISQADQQALDQAAYVVEFSRSKVYTEYIKPFLISVAEGWPDPKEYNSQEKLMLDYTKKYGEADAVKRIISFIEGQAQVKDLINEKYKNRDAFKI